MLYLQAPVRLRTLLFPLFFTVHPSCSKSWVLLLCQCAGTPQRGAVLPPMFSVRLSSNTCSFLGVTRALYPNTKFLSTWQISCMNHLCFQLIHFSSCLGADFSFDCLMNTQTRTFKPHFLLAKPLLVPTVSVKHHHPRQRCRCHGSTRSFRDLL